MIAHRNLYLIVTTVIAATMTIVVSSSFRTNRFPIKVSSDTIYPMIKGNFVKRLTVGKGCDQFNGFYRRLGITIANYYTIKDSLTIDLNKDGIKDELLILSPTSLDDTKSDCTFKIDKEPHRLLVEVINIKGTSKVREVYPNVVSNIGGVLSHYDGIFKTMKGFKIVHEAGERYSWHYTTEFEFLKGETVLTKIQKTCSFNGKHKTVEYKYPYKAIKSINIPDTLNKQCNCDTYWSKLDK
ncbi:hypothetical protein HQ865_15335 [Mucilaginibacter mali]|uniref:Uncharacterized protein n=1 Tax=Mucilaginibacter mali TaxID=2740462 RepID=A0A7D4QUD5_9SPHI|nr:hypothetical protein [Mucilaginibacter mali]QKJ31069.1 hypothetical protein HQ865_15335 [Mucilaginibacter mali]